MASRVEEYDEVILYHAKKEFLEKGYVNASLRNIAQNAAVSTSTIYTRYTDKEGLFSHLVEPAIISMQMYINQGLSRFDSLENEEQEKYRVQYADEGAKGLIDVLYHYFDEFKMLVSCSQNTFYHDFLDEIVDIDVECTKHFFRNIKSEAYEKGRISDGFLHVVTSAFYSGLFEVVLHDMPREKATLYINELRRFYNSGWKAFF